MIILDCDGRAGWQKRRCRAFFLASHFTPWSLMMNTTKKKLFLLLVAIALGAIALLTATPKLTRSQMPLPTNQQSPELVEAQQLVLQAYQLWATDLDRATSLFQQALAIKEKALGVEHPDSLEIVNTLAGIYQMQGDYYQAEVLYQRVFSIYEKADNLQHQQGFTAVMGLATMYFGLGNYEDAKALYEGALAIHETLNIPNTPENIVQNVQPMAMLMGLSLIYQIEGEYRKAESLLQRSLAVEEQIYSAANGVQIPSSLYRLANLYLLEGNYSKAESILQQTLVAEDKIPGNFGGLSLGLLGELYLLQGKYQEAESFLQRARDAHQSLMKPENYVPGLSDLNLAELYRLQGKYGKGESLLQSFITNPRLRSANLISPYYRQKLAFLYWLKGDIASAAKLFQEIIEVQERNIAAILPIGSERRKRDYMKIISEITHSVISFHLQSAGSDREAAKVALTAILQRKGRVLDTLAYNLQVIRERMNPEDRGLLEQLNEVRSQLAALVFKDLEKTQQPQQPTLVASGQQVPSLSGEDAIASLETEAQRLENILNNRSLEFRKVESPTVTIEAIQPLIPADAALVELILYKPVDPKIPQTVSVTLAERLGQPRYAAYILGGDGGFKWVDLGEAEAIDAAVLKFRKALREQPPSPDRPRRLTGGGQLTLAQIKQIARELDVLVMQPIRPLLGDRTHLLIAPDSQLNLVPFGALVDESDRFLIEYYTITYLTSGRDLLRLQLPQPENKPPLVLGNPDFNHTDAVVITASSPSSSGEKSSFVTRGTRSSNTRSLDLSRLQYEELPGTEAEISAIAPMLPSATVLRGAEATETAVKQVQNPQILHLATHGFFLSNATTGSTSVENPLLRAGLALAGFNSRDRAGDIDGVLTALEVAALSLRGTELVVLSACETGLGEVSNGDGVYGLRRAFTIAGAQSQMMSLWKVDDLQTKEMMIGYYQRLRESMGRSEAMRDIQLEMLAKYEYPYYWASFIPVGSWQPMAEAF